MKFFLSSITICLLGLSATAFAITNEACKAAWQASSAYKSCHPAWGTKAFGDKCGIYVHCKKPDGTEVANGSYNPHYDQKSKDIIGSDYSLFYTLDELKRLNNCNGTLKVGSC